MDLSLDSVTPSGPTKVQERSRVHALPTEHPLPMPEQPLSLPRRETQAIGRTSASMAFRRLFVVAAVLGLTALAWEEMYEVLKVGGLTVLESLLLGLFVVLFAWISFSLVISLIGFFVSLAGPGDDGVVDTNVQLERPSARTAILLPTYNEDPTRTMARLQAIYESIEATGYGDQFDYFILSDTKDPAIWIQEEATFLQLRERTRCNRIYYRHRTRNIARKAGNIAEWVTRFGGGYAYMLILDADSLMEGSTIIRIVVTMEERPNVALIQTLPVLLNGETLFARVQQF